MHKENHVDRFQLRMNKGKQVGLYEESHALLIGVSDYPAGWPCLESIPDELDLSIMVKD